MFIERLKEEKLKKRWEGIRDDIRKIRGGGEIPASEFFIAIAERMAAVGMPEMYPVPTTSAKTIQVGEAVESQSVPVPYEIVEHFVSKASHRFIKHFCICREAMSCKDYPIEMGCVFLGDAAKDINPELGHSAGVEETLNYLKRTIDAGLILHAGFAPADTVMLEVGPANRLMTICCCCPCCCATTLKNQMPDVQGKRRLPGVEVHVTDDCTECGECVDTCVYGFIQIGDGKAVIDPRCVACGACAGVCPENALEVRIADPDYIEKTIESLSRVLDVT